MESGFSGARGLTGKTGTTGGHAALPIAAASILLCISLAFFTPMQSWAVTSEEKQAEADAVYARIDALQTDLNEANAEYEDALAKRETAESLKDEAKAKVEEAEERIGDLQERLGARANELYHNGGSTPFLEVILGSKSFDEFLNYWTMFERIASNDAQLVQDTKVIREEAESSRAEYERQEQVASDEMDRAAAAKLEIESKRAQLTAEAEAISAEVAELKAEEARAAEEERAAAAAAEASNAPYMPSESVVSGNGMFSHPLPGGTMTSTFGYRNFRGSEYHGGVDFAAPSGTPYYAAADGTVVTAFNDGGWHGGCGNEIVISHGGGLYTIYMHSSRVYVKAGDHVTRGQNIGAVGSTGDSTGPHLHFQVELNGQRVNPLAYL